MNKPYFKNRWSVYFMFFMIGWYLSFIYDNFMLFFLYVLLNVMMFYLIDQIQLGIEEKYKKVRR